MKLPSEKLEAKTTQHYFSKKNKEIQEHVRKIKHLLKSFNKQTVSREKLHPTVKAVFLRLNQITMLTISTKQKSRVHLLYMMPQKNEAGYNKLLKIFPQGSNNQQFHTELLKFCMFIYFNFSSTILGLFQTRVSIIICHWTYPKCK